MRKETPPLNGPALVYTYTAAEGLRYRGRFKNARLAQELARRQHPYQWVICRPQESETLDARRED